MIYIILYEYKLKEQRQSNHLLPFSAIQTRKRPRYKLFCAYIPLLFPHFPHIFYAFIKYYNFESIQFNSNFISLNPSYKWQYEVMLNTLTMEALKNHMIYVYEYKLIYQNQSNHLTPFSAIHKYTPFIFPHFFL